MGRRDATTHGGGDARDCGDIVASWFAQKTYHYKKSCSGVPWQGGLPPPRSWAVQVYSPRMRTRARLGWGSALFPRRDRRWWEGQSPSRTAERTSLLPQALPMPAGGWELQFSQLPSTGNAVVRLKEYELERETVHQLE